MVAAAAVAVAGCGDKAARELMGTMGDPNGVENAVF